VVICGMDPGLRVTGYAVVDWRGGRAASFDAGVIRPGPDGSLATRLAELRAGLDEVLDECKPDVLAVESLYAHYRHPRTAIIMGHARGVILEAAGRRGIDVRDFSATQIKRHVCAHGHAGKGQIKKAIASLLGTAEPIDPPDVADALAIALCAAQILSRPQRVR
jgi:crossover junction endodeoxyribonuclease RuvC